jgi:hypothetical protein
MAETSLETSTPPTWLSLTETLAWIVIREEDAIGRARSVRRVNAGRAWDKVNDPVRASRLPSVPAGMVELTQALRDRQIANRVIRRRNGACEAVDGLEPAEEIPEITLNDLEVRERNDQALLCRGGRVEMRWLDVRLPWEDVRRRWPPVPADVEAPTQDGQEWIPLSTAHARADPAIQARPKPKRPKRDPLAAFIAEHYPPDRLPPWKTIAKEFKASANGFDVSRSTVVRALLALGGK